MLNDTYCIKSSAFLFCSEPVSNASARNSLINGRVEDTEFIERVTTKVGIVGSRVKLYHTELEHAAHGVAVTYAHLIILVDGDSLC